MKCCIPFKHNYTPELKYTLRGIEKYVDNPEVIIIGDKPTWIKNVEHIPYKSASMLQWKEKNIYEKLMLVNDDFIYFNDDHYLLEPFNFEYHYSGTLAKQVLEYGKNPFVQTLVNTINFSGNVYNYYRHQPFFISKIILNSVEADWSKEWGYCIKSVYCDVGEIVGSEYPDLKIRTPIRENEIRELIKDRPYFSTEDGAINGDMVKVLESIYPLKSKYE